MYLEHVCLENFRCFQRVDVDLPRITVLTGANSSGKSSLIYGILGALQANNFPLFYSSNGNFVDMGGYREVVRNHSTEDPFRIGITLRQKKTSIKYTAEFGFDSENRAPILNSLQITAPHANASLQRKAKKYTFRIKYDPTRDPDISRHKQFEKVVTLFEQSIKDSKVDKLAFEPPTHSFESRKFKDTVTFGRISRLRQTMLQRYRGDYLFVNVFDFLFEAFREYRRSVNYISSFRLVPDRTHYRKAGATHTIGKYGDHYIDQILEWETEDPERLRRLIEIMKSLNLFTSIRSRKIQGGRFEILVKIPTTRVLCHLSDVGFGVSQFLPIVVTDLQLPDNSTLYLSQPEIHLHPSVQANLANYLIDDKQGKNKRYVVETHSEYFLNRLRYLIVNGSLSPKDVNVMYFRNTVSGTESYNVKFTTDGRIEGAPEDFFKTYMIDVMNIALKAQ